MVFFTCNSCGSCIKKPAVEKHLYQCRSGSLSCMDCNKDFHGDSYKAHTKCVSELEKYSGEGWKAPAGHNKGEKKQSAWMDTVSATVERAGKNVPPAVKGLLHALTRHDNVPRKKPKFLNFVRNIARNHFDNGTIESVWTMLEEQWKLEKDAHTQNGKPNSTNIPNETEKEQIAEEPPAKKKKKRKDSEAEVTSLNEENTENAIEALEDSNLIKKKKKHKKNKNSEAEIDETEPTATEPPTEPVAEELVETEDLPKKKKKHKKRHATNDEDIPTEPVDVVEEQAEQTELTETCENGTDSPKKKKKKKDKH